MLISHWVHKVFLTDWPAPDVGVQQQGHFRSDATSCDLLVFQCFLEVSGKPCSDPVGAFFLPSRKYMFSIVSEGSGGGAFFDRVIAQ